ncbi:MAG: shikimate kinase [Candidatus Bathyarchaeia archaeon]
MKKIGEAVSYGAATIINAIATGKGAAFGVDLWAKARVELRNETGEVEVKIRNDPKENTGLAIKVFNKVLDHFDLKNEYGAKIETWSNIPIARGLKSSSVAANAIALATVSALNRKDEIDDLTLLNLSVDAAIDAKVTITGAFDDACASYFGGVVITDNLKREIVKRYSLKNESLCIVFLVPYKKVYTGKLNVKKLKLISRIVDIAYEEALRGNIWDALTLNGLLYSSALDYDYSIALDALDSGAIAAGLCGKGPSFTAVIEEEFVKKLMKAWKNRKGKIIKARINNKKAQSIW